MAKFTTDSKYLKQNDIEEVGNGQDVLVTIRAYRQESMEKNGAKEKKWLLLFDELEKGLVLNSTNGKTICKLMGTDDMDIWKGKQIALYVKDDVEFQGELVSAIRVRPRLPRTAE